MDIPIGLQLYTVRDYTEKDFIGTLEKIAQIGYKGVEFAGFADLSASEMKRQLDRLGLKAVGSHTDLDILKNKLDEAIDFNLEIGNKNIVCPWGPLDNPEQIKYHAQLFNRIGKRCMEKGVELSYHNHDHEFFEIDGQYGLDLLYGFTDPEYLKAQVDTCWVFFSGADPAQFIRKYSGRCPTIHLKDIRSRKEKLLTEIGNGLQDFQSIASAAKESGVEWMIVEQDFCEGDSIQSVRKSYENLRKMGLAN